MNYILKNKEIVREMEVARLEDFSDSSHAEVHSEYGKVPK